ncbi:hypothetical protein ACFOKF_02905 [Sphingobium rhizovicinum]|uniref:Uncharacterized protein n=1 Tax=Sphingobium rhizovicinum TaxID=432308 RepID=A0ABV7NAY2_9SPHN
MADSEHDQASMPEYPPPDDLRAFPLRHGFDSATYARRNPDLSNLSPDAALTDFARHGGTYVPR